MTSQVTEAELDLRTKAPRVTMEMIQNNIIGEVYHKLTDVLTVCILTLKNGFTVTGESACAAPENYRKDIGERLAREKAVEKIWPLMAYELKTKLSNNLTWFDRLKQEQRELKEKFDKLEIFLEGGMFKSLVEEERDDLESQYRSMSVYLATLDRRIKRIG